MLRIRNEVVEVLNSVSRQSRKDELVAAVEAVQQAAQKRVHSGFTTGMTVAMGVGIPALSLFCAAAVGSSTNAGIQVLFAIVGLLVMAVSIEHLKAAIQDITGSGSWQAWSLAIAVDAAIAGCELAEVCDAGLGQMGVIAMVVAAIFSMLLNVYAFFNCK